MTTIQPKPNRRARQIAVSDSVALVLCEDDSLWAYDLLVKVAEWERLPAIPSPVPADNLPPNPSPKPKPAKAGQSRPADGRGKPNPEIAPEAAE